MERLRGERGWMGFGTMDGGMKEDRPRVGNNIAPQNEGKGKGKEGRLTH